MLVGLYPRVSTQEQAKEGYSITEQIERLTKYCEAMGWTVYKVYTDPGYSGGDMDRPGLKDMIRDVKDGRLDKVVVYKLDRLSRSQKDTLYLIEDVFLANNTDFVSMTENFDTSTSFGRAMIGILAVFAQLEREKIKERMVMGKEARAKEGKWPGGSTEPIGYDYDEPNDLLLVNEYEAMQVRELYARFLEGMPLRGIETLFEKKGYRHKHGTWSTRTMRSVLQHKVYLGYIKYKGQYYKAEHDAIIDERTYDEAVKLLKTRAEQYKLTGVRHGAQTSYLGGLLYCKRCGAKYAKDIDHRRNGDKVLLYVCHSRSKRMKAMIKDPTCKNKRWKMGELDEIVFNEIRQLAADPDYLKIVRNENREQSDAPDKIKIIEAEISKLDEQISRFMDLYGIGKFTIDQVSAKIDPLNVSRENLQKELDSLNNEFGRLTEEETAEILDSFADVMDSGDFDSIRGLIESLVYYIELDGDTVYIHWKFI